MDAQKHCKFLIKLYCFLLFLTVSFCFLLFPTVSYCFLLFLTVSYCFLLFLPVSYCLFLLLSVSSSLFRLLVFFSSSFSVSFRFFLLHLVFPVSSSLFFKFNSRSSTLIALAFWYQQQLCNVLSFGCLALKKREKKTDRIKTGFSFLYIFYRKFKKLNHSAFCNDQ